MSRYIRGKKMEPIIKIEENKYRIEIDFEIPGGVCTPQEFARAVKRIEKSLPGEKAILIKGRGPIWGYGMLVHAAHPTPAVATYDPRLRGHVVVATHSKNFKVGEVIRDEKE